MDPNSGKIYKIEDDETADEMARRGFVPIPDSELETVQRMNRHDRRAWAAQQRAQQRQLAKRGK